MWRESGAVSRPNRAWLIGVLCLLSGCQQLGNPPQFATGPTRWRDEHGQLVTTTRSFRNEKTIQRLVADGLGDLDHADASIGPSQTLTLVSVVARRLRRNRGREVNLVTTFKLTNRAPIVRRWSAPASSRRWNAAFALPEPPAGAVTSVAP
jgi:hypothetical protein